MPDTTSQAAPSTPQKSARDKVQEFLQKEKIIINLTPLSQIMDNGNILIMKPQIQVFYESDLPKETNSIKK